MKQSYDTIIIGSGMGGMVAARILAEYGNQKVLVLEQHFKLGGMTHEFKRKGKYHFGSGLHYIGLKGEKDFPTKLMDYMTDGKVSWAKLPDNYDNFVYPRQSFSSSSDLVKTIAKLKEKFPDEKKAIDYFYKKLSRNVSGIFTIHAISSMPFWIKSWLQPLAKWWFSDSLITANQYLDKYFKNSELKAILASVWGDLGTPPSRMAFGYLAMLHWHYEKGGSFPIGGLKKLSETMVESLKSRGVDLLTNRYVEEILVEDGHATGVRALSNNDTEIYMAKNIISDAGAYNTHVRMLSGRNHKEKIEQLGQSTSACVLFIGLKDSPKSLGFDGGNIWIFPSIDHDFNYNAPPGEGVLYLSFPSIKDTDASHHTMEIVTLAHHSQFEKWKEEDWPRKSDEYTAYKETITRRIISRINDMYPGYTDLIDYHELATPLSFETFQKSQLGQFYGLPATTERLLSPYSKVRTNVKGLFLAGQDAISPGVIPAALGGLEASTCILPKSKTLTMMRDISRRKNPCHLSP